MASLPFPEACFSVHGEWRASTSGNVFTVRNPADGTVLASLAHASAEDVEVAVESCRAALDGSWLDSTGAERARILRRIADIIDANAEQIATLECAETGKPIIDCRADVRSGGETFRFYAARAQEVLGHWVELPHDSRAEMRREPYGVVAILAPYNYPFYIACARLAPALAAGNACVMKPSELSSLSGLLLAHLASEAGLPPGVLNVLTGDRTVGSALAEHRGVDMVCLTGSTDAGRSVLNASAASNLKAVSLELSGHCSAIVFDDTDVAAATEAIAMSGFYNVGQSCTACARVFVAASLKEELTRSLVRFASTLKIGDPVQEDTQIGPMISEEALNRFSRKVEGAVRSGATLRFGGRRLAARPFDKGHFYEPTVLEGVSHTDILAREEVFGPLLMLWPFTSPEEAVRLANDSEYGLAASVYTNDEKIREFASRRLRCGTVWCNCNLREDTRVTTSGWRRSGLGQSHGPRGLEGYTRSKAVWINRDVVYESWG